MAKSKPAVELGAFVQHPDDPSTIGRVMMTWDDDEGVRRVRATWPALRIESDHKAADLAAVERPKPKPPVEPAPSPESKEPTP